MGLMQGPDNPPVTVERRVFVIWHQLPSPKRIDERNGTTPSASTALAISVISVTLGDSFTMSVLGYTLRTAFVTRAAETADVPKAIPPSFTFGHEILSSMAGIFSRAISFSAHAT